MNPHSLKKLGEFGLIDWIRKTCDGGPGIKKGIGDDTAVMPFTAQEDLLMTTDMFVEDVHFTRDTDPKLIGRKALACNLSDIAAMGGIPTFAVVSIGLPPKYKANNVKKIYQGLNTLARAYQVYIVGGDTVKSDKVVIDVTLLGKVRKDQAILRSTAKAGDHIFVTGPLGKSLSSQRHLMFTPRVELVQKILKMVRPTAMIDISDGLASDLGHILKESRVGARLDAERIPLQPGAQLKNALYDGEDFEILFTVSKKDTPKLQALTNKSIFPMGEIIKQKEHLYLVDQHGEKTKLALKGYTHF